MRPPTLGTVGTKAVGAAKAGWDPYRRRGLALRFAPFGLSALLGALGPVISPDAHLRNGAALVVATLIAAAGLASAVLVPWRRLPQWTRLGPIACYTAAVGLVQWFTAGQTPVFDPLLTLPLFWLALYHSRSEMVAGSVMVLAAVGVGILHRAEGWYAVPEELFWPLAAVAVGGVIHALTARNRDQRESLVALARTDHLTGVLNRRGWDEMLGREIARGRRDRRPFAVVLLDLDHFKEWNDVHGHAAGDDLLLGHVGAWRGELRDIDILARLGGDEFAVLLPSTDVEQAQVVAQRLLRAIPAGHSCSVGVAVRDPLDDGAAVMARADAALYAAKAGGRGRIELAGAAVRPGTPRTSPGAPADPPARERTEVPA